VQGWRNQDAAESDLKLQHLSHNSCSRFVVVDIAWRTGCGCIAGISLAEELDVDALLSGIAPDQKQERQQKLTDTAWKATVEEFKSMSEAIHNDDLRANSNIHSQPWRD